MIACTVTRGRASTTTSFAVKMSDGCVVPRDALFVAPRFIANHDLLLGLGCEVDAAGWVLADSTGGTSVPGVWAAGNVVALRAQVITAAGAGSAAAIALNADVVEDDVRKAVLDFDNGIPPRLAINSHPTETR
jgi:thioredoxin reductase